MEDRRILLGLTLLLLIMLLASGCAREPVPPGTADGDPVQTESPAGGSPAETGANQLEISSSQNGKETDTPSPKPTPYDANHPRIFGITIGDSEAFVIGLHGLPERTFSMDDEEGEIVVYHYPHFQVGFMMGRVLFVDVISTDGDPGLHGIRLGDTAQDAIDALGDPDMRTEYVMNYKSDTAVLKLDIDPSTDFIMSIKLFAQE